MGMCGGGRAGRGASAASGDHSSIFLAQYMRMKPCILPVCTICACAAGGWGAGGQGKVGARSGRGRGRSGEIGRDRARSGETLRTCAAFQMSSCV